MFESSISLWEIALRVAIVYVGLLVMTRLSGKREIGELSPMEFLSMLILSETVSPALTKSDTSLTASLFAAACLIGISVAVGRLTYRSGALRRVVEGTPTIVMRNGRFLRSSMRREAITRDELESEMRKQGIQDPRLVEVATVETDGRISIVERKSRA